MFRCVCMQKDHTILHYIILYCSTHKVGGAEGVVGHHPAGGENDKIRYCDAWLQRLAGEHSEDGRVLLTGANKLLITTYEQRHLVSCHVMSC